MAFRRFGLSTLILIFSSVGVLLALRARDAIAKKQEDPTIQGELSPATILKRVASLRIYRWAYREQSTIDHIGPVAQEFRALFHVGDSPKHIYIVDMLGVLFACVKALNTQMQAIQAHLGMSEEEADAEFPVTPIPPGSDVGQR